MKKLDLNRIIGYFIYRDEQFTVIKLLRDWKIIFSCFSVFLIAVLLAEGYIFWEYQKEYQKIALVEENLPILKRESFNLILEELKKREEKFLDLSPHSSMDRAAPF